MAHSVAFSLFDGQPEWTEVALVLGAAFVLATAISMLCARLVRRLLRHIYGAAADRSPLLIARPVLVVRGVAFALALVVTALPLLDLIGQHVDVGLDGPTALRWLVASGLRIAIIVTVSWLVMRMIASLVVRLELELARSSSSVDEHLKRAETLGALVRNAANAVIVGVALLMILNELNVNILPMLTGAGIAGVAFGFGAQWLVRDLIAGFFLILEDQVRVGDSVVINGQGGEVEAINLRTLVLRDVEGAVHIFPNGAINTLANKTRDFAYALVDLAVAFREDSDRVITIVKDTAAELQADPAYSGAILEPLEVLGIEGFQSGQVSIRSRLKTVPQRQAEIGRELRRRLRYALEKAGVDLPPAGLHTLISERLERKGVSRD
jgi:small-conductance mechanosensitive channel